jgi:hypothetical protein
MSGSGLISLLSGMKPETIVPLRIGSGNGRAAIAFGRGLALIRGKASRRAIASARSRLFSVAEASAMSPVMPGWRRAATLKRSPA